ncbi:prohibitin-3, mitochondrial-like [Andrographis paniculata]|uniref:prohibitin-3, mitochondrial-like n=1 Tax=Andrographis paniculata TaxID=175694 RepID=UPI0021E6F65D|nr:prohibitin-3, mitochondrial-like [Andrographis paniculata]
MSLSKGELAGRFLGRCIFTGFGIALGCATIAKSFFLVNGGHCAVVFDRFRGVIDDTSGEGLHLLIPWIQRPVFFNIRTRPHAISSVSGTKDLQTVNVTLRILSCPEVIFLPRILRELGKNYDDIILPSIAKEVLKSVVAQFNAEEIVTKYYDVTDMLQEKLNNKSRAFNILVDDVSITHLSFGEEFSKAVEQKQVAQQEAERSKLMVSKSEYESKAAIVKAEGESECAKLISEATEASGTGLIELRKIEAAKENAQVLCSHGTVMYLPSNNNVLIDVKPPCKS